MSSKFKFPNKFDRYLQLQACCMLPLFTISIQVYDLEGIEIYIHLTEKGETTYDIAIIFD